MFDLAPSAMLLMAADAPRFTMLAVNRAHAAAFRTSPEDLEGQGVFEVFPPQPDAETAAFMEAVRQSLNNVMSTRRTDHMPVRAYAVSGPDGAPEERYWSATQTPLFDAGGELAFILSTVQDATAEVKERQAAEARTLLMREVDHRARNALTVVQSLVRLTQADTLEEYRASLLGRVDALARAQTSLASRKWTGALLREVVEGEVAALAYAGSVRLAGPEILLPPEHVQAMEMILHELATNAIKHGALSRSSGVVTVTWREDPPGGVVLLWREEGGPAVRPPTRAGFGSRLIQQLARQIGGSVRKDWRPEGLVAELTATLPR